MIKARVYETTSGKFTYQKMWSFRGVNLLRMGALLVSLGEEPFSRYREISTLRFFWYAEVG